jgi:hypothetical protein
MLAYMNQTMDPETFHCTSRVGTPDCATVNHTVIPAKEITATLLSAR